MKFIKPSYEILTKIDGPSILAHLEGAARTAYKSEGKIKEGSAEKLMKLLVHDKKHLSTIEHESVSVRIICDRGVSHEIVRHRLASYTQESTRYCNYSGNIFDQEMRFIIPCWFSDEIRDKLEKGEFKTSQDVADYPTEKAGEKSSLMYWWAVMSRSEHLYKELIKAQGWTPQQARSILPNSLKTEIVMTANLREWRHFFELRTDKAAHPQMREVAIPMLEEFKSKIPVIFDDLGAQDVKKDSEKINL